MDIDRKNCCTNERVSFCEPRTIHRVVCKCVSLRMKAMRGRITLRKHFPHTAGGQCETIPAAPLSFRDSFRSAYCLPAVVRASARRFLASTSGLFPIASLPRLFRGGRGSAGSGEAVAGIFAGSDGGFCAYPASTPARVVLLPQSSVAGRFPPLEALHSGPATSECDSLPLAVALRSHCSLLPPPLVDVGLPPAGFDMRRSLQLARRSMCWPFADHNESVLELPSAVRRSKLLTFLISS